MTGRLFECKEEAKPAERLEPPACARTEAAKHVEREKGYDARMKGQRYMLVCVREVHISFREVPYKEGESAEGYIDAALEAGIESETGCEYSHTMDADNHTVEGPFELEDSGDRRRPDDEDAAITKMRTEETSTNRAKKGEAP